MIRFTSKSIGLKWLALVFILQMTPLSLAGSLPQNASTARSHLEKGEWAAAETAFARLSDLRPLTSEEVDLAVRASEKLNHWERVLALYRDLEKRSGLSLQQRIRIHEAYLRVGDRPAAEKELSSIVAERPDDERLLHLLVFLYLEQDRYDDAVRSYGSFLARHPEAIESHVNLALILFKQQATSQALHHLGKAFGVDEEQADRYLHRQLARNMGTLSPAELVRLAIDTRTALGLRADPPRSYRWLAEEYKNLNRYDQAIYCFKSYLKERPADPDVRYDLARLYFLKGQDESASRVLTPLLRSEGRKGQQARLFAAELAVKRSDFQAAEGLLRDLPASFEALPSYRFLKARIALDGNRLDEAQVLLEGLTKDSEVVEAYLHLGQLYMRMGRREDGRRMLKEFQRLKNSSQVP